MRNDGLYFLHTIEALGTSERNAHLQWQLLALIADIGDV